MRWMLLMIPVILVGSAKRKSLIGKVEQPLLR